MQFPHIAPTARLRTFLRILPLSIIAWGTSSAIAEEPPSDFLPPPPPDFLPPDLPPDFIPPDGPPDGSPVGAEWDLDDTNFDFLTVTILESEITSDTVMFVVDSLDGQLTTATDFVLASTDGVSAWSAYPVSMVSAEGDSEGTLKVSASLSVGIEAAWFFSVLHAEPKAG